MGCPVPSAYAWSWVGRRPVLARSVRWPSGVVGRPVFTDRPLTESSVGLWSWVGLLVVPSRRVRGLAGVVGEPVFAGRPLAGGGWPVRRYPVSSAGVGPQVCLWRCRLGPFGGRRAWARGDRRWPVSSGGAYSSPGAARPIREVAGAARWCVPADPPYTPQRPPPVRSTGAGASEFAPSRVTSVWTGTGTACPSVCPSAGRMPARPRRSRRRRCRPPWPRSGRRSGCP